MDFNIYNLIKKLQIEDPFYAYLLLGVNKKEDDSIKTLCVSIDSEKNLTLHYNKSFMVSLNQEEQKAVLKHECLHIGFMHLTMLDEFENKEIFNVAADCEINQYIKNLPKGCVFIEDIEKILNTKLSRQAGTKYYYEKLIQNCKEEGGKIQLKEIGEELHPLWDKIKNLSPIERDILKSNIEYQLKEAAENTCKSRGITPGFLSDILDKLLNPPPPVIDWRKYFRISCLSSFEPITKKTKRKESKRFKGNPGIKKKFKERVLIGIDVSGSISDLEIKNFISQVDYIAKQRVKVDILQFDSKIKSVQKYKKSNVIKIIGRGGTDFDPPIEYYNKNKRKYDNFVIFTDGEAPLPKQKPNRRMLWVITPNGEFEKNYPYYKVKMQKLSGV